MRKRAGWPATLREARGLKVRTKREINFHSLRIPAGLTGTISRIASRWDRLTIEADACPHCGVSTRHHQFSWSDLELIGLDLEGKRP